MDVTQAKYGKQVVVTQKVYDFSDVKTEEKMVVVRPIKQRKEGQSFFQKDLKVYGMRVKGDLFYCGFPISVSDKGEIKWRNNRINSHQVFDLRLIEQARQFAFWKNSPIMSGSVQQIAMGQRPLIMIQDENAEAEAVVKKNQLSGKLFVMIGDAPDSEIRFMGFYFNIDPKLNSITLTRSKLMEQAQRDPENVSKLFDNRSDTKVRILFNMGRVANVVKYTQASGFEYRGRQLGHNEEVAVNTLTKDPRTTQEIYIEAKNIIGDTGKTLNELHLDSITQNITPDSLKDQEITDLKNQMNKMEGMMQGMLDTQQTSAINAVKDVKPIPSTDKKWKDMNGEERKVYQLKKKRDKPESKRRPGARTETPADLEDTESVFSGVDINSLPVDNTHEGSMADHSLISSSGLVIKD